MRFMKPDRAPVRLQLPLMPLIDIVFLLLFFFLLNLRVTADADDRTSNLPLEAPSKSAQRQSLAVIRVGLYSDADGNLAELTVGRQNLGNSDAAFDRLNTEILKSIAQPGNPLSRGIEVEIHADYELHYKYIVRAIAECTGRLDPQTKQMVRFVEKITFAPPTDPKVVN